jgi:hypothetical protein
MAELGEDYAMTAAEKALKIYGKYAVLINGSAYAHKALVDDIESALLEAKREGMEEAAKDADEWAKTYLGLSENHPSAECASHNRYRAYGCIQVRDSIRAKKGELK